LEGTVIDALVCADWRPQGERLSPSREAKRGSYEQQDLRMGVSGSLEGRNTRKARIFLRGGFRGAKFLQITHNGGFRHAEGD